MQNRNVINLQDIRMKQNKECGRNAYKRYLKLLENDQLETEVNYILNNIEINGEEESQICLSEKGSLIMDEIAVRTSSPANNEILKMKVMIEQAKSNIKHV